ncbi:MAG TPA: UbiD family decarboxylase [Nitrososphaerales archaeon]|nr:UbiD family decarboxylase [Nitrososphaerales archaeon]
MPEKVTDLRSALSLSERNGDLIRVKQPVNIHLALVMEYLRHAGGIPAPPPTKVGPVVLFEDAVRTKDSGEVVSYDIPVAVGVVASRERVARYFGIAKERIPFKMLDAIRNPVPPTRVSQAPSQEVVVERGINLLEQLPIPTLTADSAGPTITEGLLRGVDPETGQGDVTFHRIFILGPDKICALMGPGRHIRLMQQKAEAKNEPFPLSINIGLDPFSTISAGMFPPTGTDVDELAVAGSLMGSPVELVRCRTVNAEALANAEIVLECEMLPNERVSEDFASAKKGLSMPEMAGYMAEAQQAHVLKVKAVTHRTKPIFQTLVTPGEEHNIIVGVPCEAEILSSAAKTGYGHLLSNVYLSSAGGGKLMSVLQVKKSSEKDDAEPRNLALIALTTMHEMKDVILVDDDVDIWDPMDLWWAFTTRFNPKEDLTVIDEARSWPFLPERLQTTKAIYDCTVPWAEKGRMRRSHLQSGRPS